MASQLEKKTIWPNLFVNEEQTGAKNDEKAYILKIDTLKTDFDDFDDDFADNEAS